MEHRRTRTAPGASKETMNVETGPSRLPFLAATALLIAGSVVADVYPLFNGQWLIGHADQANLAMLARNIAEGRGAVVDAVWLLTDGGMPGNNVTHPEDYWSIYVGAIVAAFFKVFGATRLALLLPAALFKSAVALLAGYWVGVLTKQNRVAIFSAVATVALWPTMLRVVQGLSDVYLTFFMFTFITLLSFAISKNRMWLFVLSGLTLGLSIGIKPSGGLLLGIVAVFAILARAVVLKPLNLAGLTVGAVLALMPLAAHNVQSFGELNIVRPPAWKVVSKSLAISRVTGDHNRAFYDPAPLEGFRAVEGLDSTIEMSKVALKGLAQWGWAVLRGEFTPLFMLIFVPLYYLRSITGIRDLACTATVEAVFRTSVLLLVAGGAVLACVVHYEVRYWNFLFPPLVVLSVVSMTTISPRYLLILLTALAFLNGGYYYYNAKNKIVPPAYETLAKVVGKDKVILTHDPWETTFHTRIRSVALPYTNKPQVVLDIANRYGADYLVIVERQARHPFYHAMQNSGALPDFLERIYYSEDLLVARIRR